MNRILLSLAAVATLCGCAGEQALRTTSGQSALILNQYRSELTKFAARQNELNTASVERIQRWQERRDERIGEIQSRVRSWRLAENTRAIARFETLTARNAETILTSDALLSPRPPQGVESLRFDPAAVDAIIKRLVELQRPRSPIENARDLLAFTTSLRESYDKALADAAAPNQGATAAAPPASSE